MHLVPWRALSNACFAVVDRAPRDVAREWPLSHLRVQPMPTTMIVKRTPGLPLAGASSSHATTLGRLPDADLLAAAVTLPPGFWCQQRANDLSHAANVLEALAMVYLVKHSPAA